MLSELISEASRRWDDFQGGRPIRLPDGDIWQFYDPQAVVRRGRVGWTFGADVAPDVDAVLSDRFSRVLYKWKRASTDADRSSVVLEAAWFLLARNYNVTAAEFEAILGQAIGQHSDAQKTLGAEFRRLIGEACERAVVALREVA